MRGFPTSALLVAAFASHAAACNATTQEAPAPAPPAAVATPTPPPAPPAGQDFSAQARLLYRIAACAGADPLPERIDPAVVKTHCDWLQPKVEAYRKLYVGVAKPYLAALRPEGLPNTVVYPFGGGDLISALTSYPDAAEITTIALEHGGDPRRLKSLTSKELDKSLGIFRRAIFADVPLAQDPRLFSDTSGIPPRYASKAGFIRETYGSFEGTFIPAFRGPGYQKETDAFKELWKSQPHREITFRYGYPDVNHRGHLLVTRKAPPEKSKT